MKYANIIGQTQDEMDEDTLIRLNDLKSRMLNHAIDYGNVIYPAQRLEENIDNEEIVELLEQVIDKASEYFDALRQFELNGQAQQSAPFPSAVIVYTGAGRNYEDEQEVF